MSDEKLYTEEEALHYGLRLIEAAKKAWINSGGDDPPIWAASNAFYLSLSAITGKSIGELAEQTPPSDQGDS